MNTFNTLINLYETFLFAFLFYRVSDSSSRQKLIPCGIYWIITFIFVQYANRVSITLGFYQLIVDGAGIVCLLAASRKRFSQCLILAVLPDLLVAVFNTTISVMGSIILFHEVDGPRLVSSYSVQMTVLTKIAETFMFSAIAKVLKKKSDIHLNALEEYLIGIMLILCVAIIDSIETMLFYKAYNPASLAVTILCIGALSLLVIVVLVHFNQRNTQLQQQQKENMMISSQLLSAKGTVRAQSELLSLRHDLSHVITLLQNQYADDENIRTLSEKLKETNIPVSTPSSAVNLILNAERHKAEQEGIEVSYVLNIPEKPFVTEDDLYVLLVNLMDNAIEHIGTERSIKLKIISNREWFMVKTENSAEAYSAKVKGSEVHGFGLSAIRSIASRYGGTCSFQKENNEYVASAVLHHIEE
ncbi:MAG: GHKL domain-containing protein [Lachnospiraceae bacterium]|nr:GHKL domain-containing protein [Lachnospiraceae bacterium]